MRLQSYSQTQRRHAMISRSRLLISMYLADLSRKLAFTTPGWPTGNSFVRPDRAWVTGNKEVCLVRTYRYL